MRRLIPVFLAMLAFSAGASAQILIQEALIKSDGVPAGSSRPAFEGEARDANGDGVADLVVMAREASSGMATGLKVKSGDSNETWEYPFVGFLHDYVEIQLLGFYELNNNSPLKEAVFANKQGRRLNQPAVVHVAEMAAMNMQFLASQFLLDIADDDGDGDPELQIYNSQTRMIEFWGQGPKLELYPADFMLEKVTVDPRGPTVIYYTMINGEARNVFYRFNQNQTVDISVEDGSGNDLLSYNSADNFQIPEGADEAAGWLLGQNLIRSRSVGVLHLWNDYKDLFSPEAQDAAASALASIGGVIGGIPRVIFDLLCRVSGTATCSDDDGTVTITCDCGIATCVTQQVAFEVVIVEIAPDGTQTTRTEIQYKDKCVCTCQKLKDTRE